MRVNRIIAGLSVADVETAKTFYTDHLGLRTEEFDKGWVARDASAPESPLVSVLVDGYEIAHPLTTEPWGCAAPSCGHRTAP